MNASIGRDAGTNEVIVPILKGHNSLPFETALETYEIEEHREDDSYPRIRSVSFVDRSLGWDHGGRTAGKFGYGSIQMQAVRRLPLRRLGGAWVYLAFLAAIWNPTNSLARGRVSLGKAKRQISEGKRSSSWRGFYPHARPCRRMELVWFDRSAIPRARVHNTDTVPRRIAARHRILDRAVDSRRRMETVPSMAWVGIVV
jgi:hypothetical protein